MARLNKPIWTFLKGYFISTNYTYDLGMETMVFPAEDGAKEHETLFALYVTGVDFEHPYDEYTRHYQTVEEAKAGHREIVALVKRRMNDAHGGC